MGAVDSPAVEGSAVRLSTAKNDVACTARIPVPYGRLLISARASSVIDDMESCSVVVGRVVNSRMGRATREPAEALG